MYSIINLLLLSTMVDNMVLGNFSIQLKRTRVNTSENTVRNNKSTSFLTEIIFNNRTTTTQNNLRIIYSKLNKAFNKLKSLQEKVEKTKRKHFFLAKYLNYIADNQKKLTVHINGVPTLPSHEIYFFFIKLTSVMRIVLNQSDITAIWQTSETNKRNITTTPLFVKFKTMASKQKYLMDVNYYFQKGKKVGGRIVPKIVIKYNKTNYLNSIFISDHLPLDTMELLHKAKSLAFHNNFSCYVNKNKVFIRRNSTDILNIQNEHQLNVLRKYRYAKPKAINEENNQVKVQFDIYNPMIYKMKNKKVQ